jgi:hypothetical protein
VTHRRENDAPKADRAYAKWQAGLATGLANLEVYRDEIQEGRPTLTELRFKCDPEDDQGVLAIVKGYQGSQWFVAFHRADSLATCVAEVGNRLRNGSLKWREDTPYESRS